MRTITPLRLVYASLAILLVPNFTSATTLETTGQAFNNGLGPKAGVWQGQQDYTAVDFFGGTLQGTVEFAVFAPGNFQGFLNENGIVFSDPAPSEYIYAYQVTSITGTNSVTSLSVGLQNDEALGSHPVDYIPAATDYGTFAPAPIQDPSITGGGPGVEFSSVWNALPGFTPGEATGILFYSSPDVPELGFSTLLAGSASQQIGNSLPNPVPEPSASLLAVFSLFCLINRRRS